MISEPSERMKAEINRDLASLGKEKKKPVVRVRCQYPWCTAHAGEYCFCKEHLEYVIPLLDDNLMPILQSYDRCLDIISHYDLVGTGGTADLRGDVARLLEFMEQVRYRSYLARKTAHQQFLYAHRPYPRHGGGCSLYELRKHLRWNDERFRLLVTERLTVKIIHPAESPQSAVLWVSHGQLLDVLETDCNWREVEDVLAEAGIEGDPVIIHKLQDLLRKYKFGQIRASLCNKDRLLVAILKVPQLVRTALELQSQLPADLKLLPGDDREFIGTHLEGCTLHELAVQTKINDQRYRNAIKLKRIKTELKTGASGPYRFVQFDEMVRIICEVRLWVPLFTLALDDVPEKTLIWYAQKRYFGPCKKNIFGRWCIRLEHAGGVKATYLKMRSQNLEQHTMTHQYVAPSEYTVEEVAEMFKAKNTSLVYYWIGKGELQGESKGTNGRFRTVTQASLATFCERIQDKNNFRVLKCFREQGLKILEQLREEEG